MTLHDAVALIRCTATDGVRGTWYDLGAGDGTFTRALATLLTPGSEIRAVDIDARALAALDTHIGAVTVVTAVADVTTVPTSPSIDGVVMANALHFVRDQAAMLRRLRTLASCCIVVEYEERRPSRWVPYPVPLATLTALAHEAGFARVTRLGTYRSAFGGHMYAALLDGATAV